VANPQRAYWFLELYTNDGASPFGVTGALNGYGTIKSVANMRPVTSYV